VIFAERQSRIPPLPQAGHNIGACARSRMTNRHRRRVPRLPPSVDFNLVPHLRRLVAGARIKDAILVGRMTEWKMRARCRLRAKGYPAWKCRKNFLSLVRSHRALAERHGFRETDVF
jgi:hypothetical protein